MIRNIALASTLFGLSLAQNDWATACTNGKCSYQTGDGVNTAWSSIDIDATPSALSDITSAAGWKITGCSSTWASGVANIQLSCTGTAQQMALCDHLFDGDAVNKVVRLPEDCGVGAFARVVSVQEASNNVFDVALDYEFSKLPADEAKSLQFSITSSNVKDSSAGTTLRARRNLPQRRYPVSVAPRFEVGDTFDLPPLAFSKAFTLLDQQFDCPAGDGGLGGAASLNIGASVELNAQMAFGVSVKGGFFPLPSIDSFEISGTLTGNAGATVDVKASVTGTFGTGDITLFQQGLPGFTAPGILTIGPQFVLTTSVDANLELQANVRAGATYEFPRVDLVFPASEGQSSASVTPVPDALGLALEPGVTANGDVTARLTPALEFGIDVLGGLAEANVFLKVAGSATLGVNAEASAVFSPGDAVDPNASGCVNLGAGVAVTAGATGSIPGIFDKTVDFDIFKKDFNLFESCFGQAAARKSRFARRSAKRAPVPTVTRRQLSCPSPNEGGLLENVFNLVRSP